MNEEELRALVRDAVARHLVRPGRRSGRGRAASPAPRRRIASFHRYLLPQGGDGDGAVPDRAAVRCNHCGYCQSHGF